MNDKTWGDSSICTVKQLKLCYQAMLYVDLIDNQMQSREINIFSIHYYIRNLKSIFSGILKNCENSRRSLLNLRKCATKQEKEKKSQAATNKDSVTMKK